jgi:hypothetical protein
VYNLWIMSSMNVCRFTLLQILARRIIFDAVGKVADYELISSIVHLRSILQDLCTPEAGMVVRNTSA